MQGILQLPAFLEEIQKGFPDSRRAVLPLANELRGARGVERFPDPGARSGVVLHGAASNETLKRFDQIDGIEKARRIRAAYQQVLLSVLKGEDSTKGARHACRRSPSGSNGSANARRTRRCGARSRRSSRRFPTATPN